MIGATAGVEVGTERMFREAIARRDPVLFVVTMMDKEHADFDAIHFVPWSNGLEKAVRLVLRQGYGLLVVIAGAVDEAGHAHGADSPEYRAAIEEVDRVLGEALAAIDLRREFI